MTITPIAENCYVRIVPPLFIGVANLLMHFQKRGNPEENTQYTFLQRVAMSTSYLAAAIILSLVAFHYPKSHEGMKKHVLVFLTFAGLTRFTEIMTRVPKADSVFTSLLSATTFCVIDAWVWIPY
jgi:hypothetical protein